MLLNTRSKSLAKTTTIGDKLMNPTVATYRLNNEQKKFYTNLFRENASNGKVKRENFLHFFIIFSTYIIY